MSSPEVSVVLPTRNRRGLLETTLATALAQENVELEVIVIDDASTDGTADYLQSVEDPRVRVLRNVGRTGVALARNRGIDAARGEWIAFLDDDDRWLPNRVRVMLDIGAESGADFVVGAVAVIDPSGRKLETWAPVPAERLPRDLTRSGTIAGPSAVIAKAELLERTGGFDAELSYLADWELWLRFAENGTPAVCEEALVEYLQHPGSMLLDDETDIHAEFSHLRERHPQIQLEALFLSRWFGRRLREEGQPRQAARHYLREAVAYNEAGSLLRAGVVLFGEGPMRVGRRIRRTMLRRGVLKPRNEDERKIRSGGNPTPWSRS
jgi:glycosyltransferase involved in cell wall biosynthesis